MTSECTQSQWQATSPRVQSRMADPDLPSNPSEFQRVAKAASELQEQVEGFNQYRELEAELEETRSMLKDSEGACGGVLGAAEPCGQAP